MQNQVTRACCLVERAPVFQLHIILCIAKQCLEYSRVVIYFVGAVVSDEGLDQLSLIICTANTVQCMWR